MIDFQIGDFQFTAINADATFRPNPSISMMVNFHPSRYENPKQRLDEVWSVLIENSTTMMDLDSYKFNEHYG